MLHLLLALIVDQSATWEQSPSPLINNAGTSDYRALVVRAPADGKDAWTINEIRGASLVDAGNIKRQPDGSFRVPVIFIRPSLTTEPDREIIVYYDATVRCGSDYDSGTPSYERASGPTPLRPDMDWRPHLIEFELGLLSNIVCTPIRDGWDWGPMTREEIVGLLDPDTPETIAALAASYRAANPRRRLSFPRLSLPQQALDRGVETGEASVSCEVDRTGNPVSCAITHEAPLGLGFGALALSAAGRTRWSEGEESSEEIRITFSPSE